MKFRKFDSRARLVRRPWTAAERRIVSMGVLGRLTIAAEAILGTLVFLFLTWGVYRRAQSVEQSLIVLVPVFALGALAFILYGIALMVEPIRAFLHTFRPIYIVDGYVRYRGPDEFSGEEATGYVAVLFENRDVACEWEAFGAGPLPDRTIPTLCEFSTYGGIHKIDGKSTGLLPEKITTLNIGMAPRSAPMD
ncbi:MAG: hypothetical protein ABR584_05065 [Candidatus Baltobacteraceae bacterium]